MVIHQILDDFAEGLSPEEMRDLRRINWTRQIRIKLTFQDPENTRGIFDEINAAYPEGITLENSHIISICVEQGDTVNKTSRRSFTTKGCDHVRYDPNRF